MLHGISYTVMLIESAAPHLLSRLRRVTRWSHLSGGLWFSTRSEGQKESLGGLHHHQCCFGQVWILSTYTSCPKHCSRSLAWFSKLTRKSLFQGWAIGLEVLELPAGRIIGAFSDHLLQQAHFIDVRAEVGRGRLTFLTYSAWFLAELGFDSGYFCFQFRLFLMHHLKGPHPLLSLPPLVCVEWMHVENVGFLFPTGIHFPWSSLSNPMD